MMLINSSYFFIYCALVRRSARVIRQRMSHAIINAIVRVTIDVIEFGGLFPAMGVAPELISPLFVGALSMQLLFQGMGFSLRMLFDVKFTRFIDYHLTLPLPKRWLFASYITYFCMEAALITLPLFTIGIVLLGDAFQVVSSNYILFFILYSLSLIFFGVFFLGLSFYYTFDWFMQNLWPRRLTFLLMFSPSFFIWYKLYTFSPWSARLMLMNPITYSIEGLRAALIGGFAYIPAIICIPALAGWIMAALFFAARGIQKRLDPV